MLINKSNLNIKITFQSFDILKIFQVLNLLKETKKIELRKIVFLPKKSRHYCVLRSPHVNKCSREQFKICIYKIFILIRKIDIIKFNSIKIPSGILVQLKKKS